jgi:hypothetical protein
MMMRGVLADRLGTRHLRVGGLAIDTAVTEAFLAAVSGRAFSRYAMKAVEIGWFRVYGRGFGRWEPVVEQRRVGT